jgi:hypothetical protein
LSFAEYVGGTELHLQSATVALRLEDFTINPLKEFSKIVEVMAVDLDLSQLCLPPPRSSPDGYLGGAEQVAQFRNFAKELSEETRRRLEDIGYKVRV